MSTNKTTNYNLHSWIPQDEFHLAEINQNFALLDAALKALDGEKVELLCGSYNGNNAADGQAISLGVQPRAVLVCSRGGFSSGGSNTGAVAIRGLSTYDSELVLTASGFQVKNYAARINVSGSSYFYLAIL